MTSNLLLRGIKLRLSIDKILFSCYNTLTTHEKSGVLTPSDGRLADGMTRTVG